MDYAQKQRVPIFYSSHKDLCQLQRQTIQNAPDLNTIMNSLWFGNPVWANSFDAAPTAHRGEEIALTPVQFGKGNLGWYFLYGIAGNYCFNVSFFRCEFIPPSAITSSMNIDRSQTCAWAVLGGYGTLSTPQSPGQWYSIPLEWLILQYTQPSYNTFSLQGQGNILTNVSLQSVNPMQFTVQISFTDTQGNPRQLLAMLNANSPPTANMPNACMCGHGLGSMYYSYTDMAVSIVTDQGSGYNGQGWLDHQLIKGGFPTGWYTQALLTLNNAIAPPATDGWLWWAIQDAESGNQYMLIYFFGRKTYSDSISIGKVIYPHRVNVYEKGSVHLNPETSIYSKSRTTATVTEMVSVSVNPDWPNINLPSKYDIVLPSGKEVILSIATMPNIYTNFSKSYETPAFLYRKDTGAQIGTGLIEANHFLSNDQLATLAAQYMGTPSAVSTIKSGMFPKHNWWQVLLAVLVVLIPLWLLIALILFVRYGPDNKNLTEEELRKNRLGLGIFIVICISVILIFSN
jgi:hypothetical protein